MVSSSAQSSYIATTEPTNIVLYSYAAAPCEAVYVICDQGSYHAVVFCNYVLPDTESIPLENLYLLYGIQDSSDIASISVVDDWFEKNKIGVTLTDHRILANFYTASLALPDYSTDAYHRIQYGHLATEEELLQAYDETSQNTVTLLLETMDGLRFCLEYDPEGGWIYGSGAMRYYRATEEIANWFSKHIR